MPESIQEFAETIGLTPETLGLAGIALGVLLFVLGLASTLSGPTAEERRLRAVGGVGGGRRGGVGSVLQLDDNDPTGILRALVPKTRKERSDISRRLRRAGVHGKNAVQYYYVARAVLGILFPAIFVALLFIPPEVPIPIPVRSFLQGLSWQQSFYILTLLVLVGFFAPALWLKAKTDDRKTAIEQSLPNALDLLTVSVEAGLGFDAAMARVAHEIRPVAPALADEFTILQLELQAGKDRQSAFLDMADRAGVEEMTAFANVIVQSMQFGTSIADSLTSYAREMRQTRELRAQEKANKLPVKMSAVLAGIMMPVLLMICLTPVMIRWLRMFAEI